MDIILFDKKFMEPLFNALERCVGIEQNNKYHPEKDVFNHSLQVLRLAFRETIDTDLILAAMLHDVGKADNKLGHDKIAVEMLEPFLSVKTLWLIENHMRIWYFLLGEMKKLSKVKELGNHPWLPELIFLARWDKKGRKPNVKVKYDRQDITDRLNKCIALRFEQYE